MYFTAISTLKHRSSLPIITAVFFHFSNIKKIESTKPVVRRIMALLSCENRPMMLKDFLRDDSHTSSNGFPMNSRMLISSQPNKPSGVLIRSRSKKAAATTISAIHKVINVVKLFQFGSVRSPLVLPRSISRKFPKSRDHRNVVDISDLPEVKVKVKDILRWKSFRDLVEDEPVPLDVPASPNRSTTGTTTSCSQRSSWCDSDFTAEDLPPWGGETGQFFGKKCFLGQPADRKSKADWSMFEEMEQQSPVSVLDSPFRQVEEFLSPSHPTLANLETMLTRRPIQEPKLTIKLSFKEEIAVSETTNAAEEKAKQLLSHLTDENDKNQEDYLTILDFFMHELSTKEKFDDVEFDSEIVKTAKSWMNGEYDDESYEWVVEDKRMAYVKDMEKGVCWHKFEQEQEEMSLELQVEVLDDLVNELLADFLCK
ncbi:UNVERIFIED_CONTAM: hypothetical protein Slati_0360400 [Sesamum latifolium]|uniref:DUF4378 domain-containing protein n=1 Tax=Sesamum latifolium TaxID=2727402 RepID=A0AAW2YFW6_9LAMI